MKMNIIIKFILYLFFVIELNAIGVYAANFTLEIMNVEEVGVNNRIRFAYTGIEYKVKIAAEGGLYPFVWELTANPSGMTINSETGVITWSTPVESGSPHTVTVKVTDAESSTDTELFTVTVTTSTDRFLFVDATNGSSGGSGAIGDAFATLSDFWASNHAGKIVYFRTGSYEIPHDDDEIRHASKTWIQSTNPFSYLGYPGETAIIDCESDEGGNAYPGYLFAIETSDVYFGHLDFDNMYYYGISNHGEDYLTVYDCDFLTAISDGEAHNQAYINYMAGTTAENNLIANNTFEGSITGNNFQAIETYTVSNLLIEDNTISGMPHYGVFFKATTNNSTIRHNVIDSCAEGIGQFAGYGNDSIEICFNYIYNCSVYDLYIVPDGAITNHYIYRNTFLNNRGRYLGWRDENGDMITSVDYRNNVVVNDLGDSGTIGDNAFYRHKAYFRYVSITAYNNIIFANNLEGDVADNIVDKYGNLTQAYHSYLGSHGWQIGPSTNKLPYPPVKLRIER